VVAKESGITRASETPQTIIGKLSLLEESLGESLFPRVGRNLELTEIGRLVLSYADEIFSLGNELEEMVHNFPQKTAGLQGGRSGHGAEIHCLLRVGPGTAIAGARADRLPGKHHQCSTGGTAIHCIDLVIADGPIPQGVNVRGFNHSLGECGITFFATPRLARKLSNGFPHCLNSAPLLLPSEMTVVQNRLLQWFDRLHIHPQIVGEFDDSALMKVFGRAGTGVFIAPAPTASEVVKQYDVVTIGQTDEVLDHFYAISVERKISHPVVAEITEAAREWLVPDVKRQRKSKRSSKKI